MITVKIYYSSGMTVNGQKVNNLLCFTLNDILYKDGINLSEDTTKLESLLIDMLTRFETTPETAMDMDSVALNPYMSTFGKLPIYEFSFSMEKDIDNLDQVQPYLINLAKQQTQQFFNYIQTHKPELLI